MTSKKGENNEKTKEMVTVALNKLSDPQKIKSGQEQIRQLVNENSEDEKTFNLILNTLSEKLTLTKKDERREYIKIFPLLAEGNSKITLLLPKILSVLQSTIIDENSKYFNIIADTFGEIVVNSWKQVSNDSDKKTIYDYLAQFCINNMKTDIKANQVSGSLCLSRLIENCPLILSNVNIKNVWDNMCSFLEKLNFYAKSELLDALISLIFAAESLFKPYATVTLYKILDYLTDSDWIKRKLAVDIIYTLANYCQEEIFALKAHIIEFLKVLKSDRIKQVREACLVTLKFLNDNEDISIIEESKEIKIKDTKTLETVNKSFSNSNVNNSLLSNQEKKPEKPKKEVVTEKKKSIKNTTIMNTNPNNISTTSNKSPFITNEPKPPRAANTPDRKKKREVSKTPEKMNISIDKIVEKSKNHVNRTAILTESSTSFMQKEEKVNNRNSITKMKNIRKREDSINIVKSDSPIKIKKEMTSIFKGPKNNDFFNNVPKENGIQIIVAEKKTKSTSPLLNNSGVIDNEEHLLSESNWMKSSENQLKTPDSIKPQSSSPNHNNINKSPETNLEVKFEENEYGSIDDEKRGSSYNSRREKKNEFLQNSPQFSSLVNGEDHPKSNERKEIHNNEQRVSIDFNNHRSFSSNIVPSTSPQTRSNENSEILKQMKDMSEKQIILIDTLEKLQKSCNEQISIINQRLSKLENVVYNVLMNKHVFSASNSVQNLNNFNIENQTISSFSEKKNYDSLNSFQNNDQIYGQFSDEKPFYYPNNQDNVFDQVITLVKNNNMNEAINISLKKDNLFLIKVVEKTNFYQFKELKITLLDEMISKLLNMLTRKEYIPQIIHFLKNITLIYNFELRTTIQKNIKDVLTYVIANKTSGRVSEEDSNDIGVIISFINNKLGESIKVNVQNDIMQSVETEGGGMNANYVYVKSNRITKK